MDPHQQRPAEWYRPGDVEKSEGASGLYRVGDDGQPEVTLHGSWSDAPSMFSNDPDFLDLFHGNVFGLSVTVVGGRLSRSTKGMSRLQNTTILPRCAVEGLWLGIEELALTEVHVQFWDQEEWSLSDAFRDTTEDSGRGRLRVEYQPPEGRTAEVSQGSVKVVDASDYRQTMHPRGWVMESSSAFSMSFKEPVTFDDLFSRWLVPLEFLIMTATGRPTGIRSLRGTNDRWEIESVGRPFIERWVDIRVSHAPRPAEVVNQHELLHLLPDFDFARQMPLVLDVVNRHRYSVEHFAALKGAAGGHLARFVAAAQLVESFDRSLHDEQGKRGLDARLNRLSRESGGVLDEIIGHKRWAKHVARVRDIVVHGLETSEQLTRDVRSIQVATEILLLLFEARLLVAFGFPAAVAQTLIERRNRHWQIKASITENYTHLEEIARRDK